MSDCLFCKIIAKLIPSESIYEDEAAYAFLDIHPTNPGHVLVVPKVHSTGLLDAETPVLQALLPIVQKIGQAVKTARNADGLNILQNEGAAAGQMIEHLHVHIIPRFNDDGFKHWHGADYSSSEVMAEVAESIRKALV